jgi:hypothetical protein
MNQRPARSPAPFRKPEHWSDAPAPEPSETKADEELSPTRYGDWVKNGIAIDF